MKPKEISEIDETYKKETGFVYDHGSICSLGREPSLQEEHWERKQDNFDRIKAGKCPRCGGEDFRKDPDGRVVCQNDGLVLSKKLAKQYGF